MPICGAEAAILDGEESIDDIVGQVGDIDALSPQVEAAPRTSRPRASIMVTSCDGALVIRLRTSGMPEMKCEKITAPKIRPQMASITTT